MRRTILALSIIFSLFSWNSAAASTLLSQPIQNQQALLYYGGQTNQVTFDQGAVSGTITTLRLWLQSTTTRSVYLGWQSADGNAGNYTTGTVSGGNVWQWVDFDLTWSSSYYGPIATSTRTFSATSSVFFYYIPSYQGAPDVLAGCMQATSSLVYFMGGFYTPQCGTPTFELLGVSTSSPTATSTDPCTGVENCYSNVLFLPGIEASRLYAMDDPNCVLINCENQLWEPNRNDDVRKLFLDQNGKSTSAYDIYTRDVIDEVNLTIDPLGATQSNVYKSFLSDLQQWKETDHIITDYSAVPYDWRLSLDDILNNGYQYHNGTISYSDTFGATNTPYIIQELKRLAASSRTDKVTIIAHSNGGLVTKALVKKLGAVEAANLIDKIIFVDVPQLGTPQAIGALLHGYEQGLPKDWLPFFLSPEVARTFASTSPMPYHLLPSAAYFQGDGGVTVTPPVTFTDGTLTQPFISAYGHGITSATELHNFLLGAEGRTAPASGDTINPSILKPAFLAYGENTHQDLDDDWVLPPSIALHQIAGWGEETLGGIRYWAGTECTRRGLFGALCLEYGPKLQYTPEMVIDGDGTVVTPSMLAVGTSSANVTRWWVDLKEYNKDNLDRKHADILEVATLRTFIRNNISGDSRITPLAYISTSTPPTDSLERLRFFLHSPLSLSVQDPFGNEISASTSTIPGARYKRFGEVQYISLLASSTPTLVLNGLAQGSFTLEVQEVQDDTITATTTFAGIPSATGTIVTMNFSDGTIAHAGALNIDADGNGTVDLSLIPMVGETVTLHEPKLPLTVTANNKIVILGAPIPTLTATLSGFQNGDTATSSTIGSPICTTTATVTSPIGVYSITCTIGTLASEKYDFTAFATGTFTILYKWSGFLQPINDTTYNQTQSLSVFKGGSTVPVKFQLKNSSDVLVQAGTAPIWLTPQKLSSMSASIDESTYSEPATSGTTYRYDATSSQYIYNWSTKGLQTGFWYRIFAKLDDGMVQSVVVGVR